MNISVLEHNASASNKGAQGVRSITQWKRLFEEKGLLKKTSDPEVFKLTDPHGVTHRLSFAPWSGRDPDRTFLMISFRWQDPKKVGTTKAQ